MDELVILVDVDYTLLDGAEVRARIVRVVEASAGEGTSARFWAVYDETRGRNGYAHVPQAAGRFAIEHGIEPAALLRALEEIPFAECLYEGAVEALLHLATLGLTVVLSDGDERFQRHKIAAAGIEAAVGGRVLVMPGKVTRVDQVRAAYPARRYALFEDRASILAAFRERLGDALTTVLVRHAGARYVDEALPPGAPQPDIVLPSIRAALDLDAAALSRRGAVPANGSAT